MQGIEVLPPSEDGYTKVFQGGDVVSIEELEAELMKRNKSSFHNQKGFTDTISISYKHYASMTNLIGDDHRICLTALRAISQLIEDCGPGPIRFWIDTKLPPTTHGTFERWLNRGVRPYGRYITFICPSAQQYAESSFWLSNEYHIAYASKEILLFNDKQIYYKAQYGCQLELRRRFLRVLVQAENQPVDVRVQDKGKVIHWAMCCLRAGADVDLASPLSPSIDRMSMGDDGED